MKEILREQVQRARQGRNDESDADAALLKKAARIVG